MGSYGGDPRARDLRAAPRRPRVPRLRRAPASNRTPLERMRKALLGLLLSLACGSAAAQTLFFDDFNNEFPGLNRVPNGGWTVTSGTVDIIGNGPNGELFDARPGNGYYIDLDGSSNPPNAGLLSIGLTFAA